MLLSDELPYFGNTVQYFFLYTNLLIYSCLLSYFTFFVIRIQYVYMLIKYVYYS